LAITVSGPASLPEVFRVTGFSATGRVVNAPGDAGISGAEILVDGKPVAVTDSQGKYKIEVTTGSAPDVTARKAHVAFKGLKKARIAPQEPRIPDIAAVAHDICGTVTTTATPAGAIPRIVTATNAARTQTKIRTAADGSFCSELTPGVYTLTTQVSAQEAAAGVRIRPVSVQVDSTRGPVSGVEFAQETFGVSGRIETLLPAGAKPVQIAVSVSPAGKRISVQCTESCEFSFKDLLAGTYTVTAEFPEWVWAASSHSVSLDSSPAAPAPALLFRQTGFTLRLDSSHATEIVAHPPQGSRVSAPLVLALPAGSVQLVSLPAPGVRRGVPRACAEFQAAAMFRDTG
jgi:hypothetical protein